jgi:hypothetical protein
MRSMSTSLPAVAALAVLGSFAPILRADAQSSGGGDAIPAVTIRATDNLAGFGGDPGTFTVYRAGNPTPALNIYYCVSGSAVDGVDYRFIGSWVQIPSGEYSGTIRIEPIDLGQTDIKTVTVELCPSPLMIPVNYEIGLPGSATVYLAREGIDNVPPEVAVLSPANGSAMVAPANWSLVAKADDPDGTVAGVEFFAGDQDLGPANMVVLDPPGINGVVGPVYFLQWQGVPAGNYVLTAVATDSAGAATTSEPVKITVTPGSSPPANVPPVIRIVSPPAAAVFHSPLDVPLLAYAHDPDGTVVSVEFFDGTESLGQAHPVEPDFAPLPPVPSPAAPADVWELKWSNAPAGVHTLTAVATDDGDAAATSDAIRITILPPVVPPVDYPPRVSIIATDPLAIGGTNGWPWLGLATASPTWNEWIADNAAFRVFTNWGPRTAAFSVRRHGATNDDLTVNYEVGGTAVNGVDYLLLPGKVTIPAGRRSVIINIVPLEDPPASSNRTVVLTLVADTGSSPEYVLGIPQRAAALILAGPGPRPRSGILPEHRFHLFATGPDGAWFHIDYSTDLLNWTPVCTNQVVQGAIDFIDPEVNDAGSRFYRAIPEPAPSAE